MKKFLSLAVIIISVFTFCTTVFAEVGVYALGSATRTSSLVITGTKATCTSIYNDDSNSTTRIVITQTLEKDAFLWTWETIGGTRTKTVNGSTATLTGSVSGLESGTYRVKTVFEVTADGETETITVYSAEKTVD